MRNILNVAILSMRLTGRERGNIIILFLMPAVLMAVIGSAIQFGGPTLRIDVINEDIDGNGNPTELSQNLIEQMQQVASETETVIICIYGADDNPEACELGEASDLDDMTERLEDTDAAAGVVIPAGFDEELRSGNTTIDYRAQQGLNSATVVQTTVNTAMSRVASSVLMAREGEDFITTYDQAITGLENPPAVVQLESSGEQLNVGEGFNQSVPGTATMFVLIGLLGLATDLVFERERGTLQRLMVLPVPRYQTVLGKILGKYVFGIGQFIVFILIGMLFGVEWGSSYFSLALVVLSFSFASTALGFLMATIVTTSEQANTMAVFMAMVLAPLGGAWFPLEIMPDFMQSISYVSPISYAMRAFNELIYFNGGLSEVLPSVLGLIVIGIALTVVGIMRFEYE